MKKMIICEPIALQAGWITGAAAAGFPASNLADEQPLVIWKGSNSGPFTIDLNLQADVTFDTVFLGFTSALAGTTWEIRSATSAQGTGWLSNAGSIRLASTSFRASADALGPRYHGFWRAAAPFSARYLRLVITGGGANMTAGVLVVSNAFEPTYGHEWQSGRGLEDLSLKERLPSGAMSVDPRAIFPTWRWTLGDLTDADVATLWSLIRRRAASRPVLIVEDPDTTSGLHERLHYGTLKDLQEYSREDVDKTRWEFSVEEWL
jgi:hypothetical protein